MTSLVTVPPVLRAVVGQEGAVGLLAASVRAPVHAYLFHGPPGTGKSEAAVAFAAALLCERGGCATCESCQAVLGGAHPDVVVAERDGAAISVEEARALVALSQRSPRSGRLQVIVLVDFHLVGAAAPALLKTIEEPPDTTVFVVLADQIPRGLVTIASRCLTVEFRTLDRSVIEQALVAEGVPAERAARAAGDAAGRLDRARLLASDPGFAERSAWWSAVPARLDGTGASVVALVAEAGGLIEGLLETVRERQARELEALGERAAASGERRLPGRGIVEDRHKREQRRVRTDELRAGLAGLTGAYRARIVADEPAGRLGALLDAIDAIGAAGRALSRNANEDLLLEALFCRLDELG